MVELRGMQTAFHIEHGGLGTKVVRYTANYVTMQEIYLCLIYHSVLTCMSHHLSSRQALNQ